MHRLYLTLGLVAGCHARFRTTALPDALVAVARLESGDDVSLLVELPRPGEEPVVRVTPGVVVAGPGFLRSLNIEPVVEAGGRVRQLVEWTDPLAAPGSEPLAQVLLDASPKVLSVDRDGILLSTGGRAIRLDGRTGTAAPVGDEAPGPGGDLVWPGPRHGFEVRCNGHRLEMLLPRMDPDQAWLPLWNGVDGLLGAWWIALDGGPARVQARLQSIFKVVGRIIARPAAAVVDGDLSEWAADPALPVDDPAHVLEGDKYWSGPRDGGYGVAARRSAKGVALAIRIRDDVLIDHPDRGDRLDLFYDHHRVRIPIRTHPGAVSGDGWRAVFTEPRAFGTGLEVELDNLTLEPGRLDLPLVVQYADHDSNQGVTLLGTAPSLEQLNRLAAGSRVSRPATSAAPVVGWRRR